MRRVFKYRVVLRGEDVRNQSFEVALFQEMVTTPTTLEASRYCDLQSLFPCCSVDGRNVEQAYLLVPMERPATYIVLLYLRRWTETIHRMRRPVVLLERALYGQPLAGAFWQKY